MFNKSHMIFSTNRRLRNIQKCCLLDRVLRLHWPWTCFEIDFKTLVAKTRWLCAVQAPVRCNNARQLDLTAYFNKNKNKKSSAIKIACRFLYRKNEKTSLSGGSVAKRLEWRTWACLLDWMWVLLGDMSSSPHPAFGQWLVYCGKVTSPLFPTPSDESINRSSLSMHAQKSC